MKDSRGTEIVAGQKVAYNRSGDVVEGVVIDVKPGHAKIQPTSHFFWPSRRGKGFSRVKNGRSILVLP